MSISTLPLTDLGSAAAAVIEKIERQKKEPFASRVWNELNRLVTLKMRRDRESRLRRRAA